MIIGPPGSGKTAVGKLVGHAHQEFCNENVAFYVSARTTPSLELWLDHIKAYDHPRVLFIIDDLHNAVTAGNELVACLGSVSRAKLLIITRPLNAALQGPSPESYIRALEYAKVESSVTEDDLAAFINLTWPGNTFGNSLQQATDEIRKLARGDLHLVDY